MALVIRSGEWIAATVQSFANADTVPCVLVRRSSFRTVALGNPWELKTSLLLHDLGMRHGRWATTCEIEFMDGVLSR